MVPTAKLTTPHYVLPPTGSGFVSCMLCQARAIALVVTNRTETFPGRGGNAGRACVVGSTCCWLCDLPTKMAVEDLTALERCLGLKAGKYSSRAHGNSQIPVLQPNRGPSLAGLATIASHLVTEAKKDELLGASVEEKAVVQQWLEYRVTHIDRSANKEEIRNILKDLNLYLEDKVYMAGNKITLADILIYYGLHPAIADLSVQEKETYINVSRWFSHIQHYPGVRQHLPSLVFIKNRIYTNLH